MGIKALNHLCCQIWKQQEWPEDWKLQEFVMLYKNGNSKECGNYRTIALISNASKILLIIILNRMKCKVEEELSDCQAVVVVVVVVVVIVVAVVKSSSSNSSSSGSNI
ncbi:RNA-directed DNA polymerase (Reverse transcriptase) domain containing protein [Elysia marginata]|uniref:RNA-directed DNA polymerase (Reverse transcriptase) domain containing protein n=1 Tax=Elysia marginata TaxID=1093978 RepID=A0AAV4EX08_9GAST|nr:RNA-directed DNA polymerase (Reverse transcriptase) domain containing protein [Elysia marginata]